MSHSAGVPVGCLAGVPPASWASAKTLSSCARPGRARAPVPTWPGVLLLQGLQWRRHFPAADVVPLELAIKRCPADAQHFPGKRFVALHLLEDSLDGRALNVLEVSGRESGGRRRVVAQIGRIA